MTRDSPIVWMRMHGWGVVGSEDALVLDCATTDNAAGVATLYITSVPLSINADQVGSEVYISGVTGLEDGFYTLSGFTSGGPSPGSDTVEIKGDPANFALVPGGGIYVGSAFRIEDHYKLCSYVPDFVTGADARARWFPNIIDLTPTLSSQVELLGGIGKLDGMTLTHNYLFQGLDRSRFKVLNEKDPIITSRKIYLSPTTSTNITVENGIPYLDSYDTPNTAPAQGNYEPTWWGSECIRVDSATGSGPYTLTMTRSLLRTIGTSHPYGQQFYDGFTTPVGRVANVFKGLQSADRYDDFTIVADGPVSAMEYDEGVTATRMEITSDLLRGVRSPVGELYTEVKPLGSGEIEYFLAGSNTWSWVRAGDCCLRVASIQNNRDSMPTYDDSLRLDLITTEEDGRAQGSQYGYTRVIAAVINRRFVEINGQGLINGVLVKRQRNANDYAKWQYPAEHPVAAANSRFPGNNQASEEQRTAFIDQLRSNNLLFWATVGEIYPPEYDLELVFKQEEEPLMAHVFEPQHFGPDNSFTWSPAVAADVQALGCNPIDAILQILLTQSGRGLNTFTKDGVTYDFDILPTELGLGFSPNQLDLDSFFEVAEQFRLNNYNAFNVYIDTEKAEDVTKWLDNNLLQPYFLSLSTDNRGRLVITQLADSAKKPGMVTLTDEDLFSFSNDAPVTVTRDTGAIINRITYTIERAYLTPENPSSKDTINYRFAYDGIADHYKALGSDNVTFKPDFSPFYGEAEAEAWTDYLGRIFANYRVPFPVVEAFVDEDFYPDKFSPGKYQLVDLSRIPAADGTDTNLQGVALVVKRARDILQGVDKLTLAVIETTRLDQTINFAPSARIDATVTSDTDFDLVDSEFIPTFLSSYPSDGESFAVGDAVLLVDGNFTIRSTDGPAIVATRSATNMTITAPWTASAVPVTPDPGDIVILANKSAQTVGETLTDFAYVYAARNDASFWEVN